ncbi:MAG: MerR family transcriptional regulator [Nitrospirota bacterium]|nr:MerR family transcriptional regulator [Nitrospirota bacterium]
MSSTPPKSAAEAAAGIPDKLFFRIGEVAKLAGVQPYVLRYWETEFPELAPHKGAGGQRRYERADVELVLTIRDMLHKQGFTIAGARRKLADSGSLKALTAGAAPIQEPTPRAEPAPETAPNSATTAENALPTVQNVRKGLRELLRMMENTDARRADIRSRRNPGARD